MRRPQTLQDLLLIEDDPSILTYRCSETDLLLWPQIRGPFYRMILSDMLYATPIEGPVGNKVSVSKAIATISRSVLRSVWFRVSGKDRADLCLTSTGVANQLIDGKWWNRLGDYFVSASAARTLAIEDHFEWNWPFPRHNNNVVIDAPRRSYIKIAGRLRIRPQHRRLAQELVDTVAQRAWNNFDWSLAPHREVPLVETLAMKIASMPTEYRWYERLLKHVQPKLLMIEGACYGRDASLVAAARKLGVVTVEYQHGAISAGHEAYNFAPTVRDSEAYRQIIPEHFLTYGAWWGEQINAPMEMTTIGNPHRDFKLTEKYDGNVSKDEILILSDGFEFDLYLDLAKQILPAATKKDLRVAVRPHPFERSSILGKFGGQEGGVRIDENADFYRSLRNAHVVVSDFSTGLFEAAGIANKPLLWSTDKAKFTYPVHPFGSFSSAAELEALLDDDNEGQLSSCKIEAMWASGWRSSFQKFLSQHGIGEPAHDA